MAFVQGTSNTTAAGTPISFTFGSNTTAGNTIVGVIATDDNLAQTITPTFNSVACTVLDQVVDGVNGVTTTTFILGNVGAATGGSVGWTGGNSNAVVIVLEESNCLATANPTDVHTGQLQTATTNPTSGNVTTTVANDNIIGFSQSNGGTTTFTAGSGFTLRTTSTLLGALPTASEDSKVQASPGSVAATFGNTQSTAYSTFVVAIKPPAVAATGSTLPLLGVA